MNSLKPLTVQQQQWVDSTFESLTLREKIGQTSQEICNADMSQDISRAREYFEKYPLGGVFCGGEIIKSAGSSPSVVREQLRVCQKASRVPLLVAGDLEHGAGAAIAGLTKFPTPISLGVTDDEALAYNYGKYTALEGRSVGYNWTFSPVVDLLKNWMNPIVSTRALGDNPERVIRLAQEIVRGVQEQSMAACAKHFPGDGVDFRDQHLVTSINYLSEEEWWANHGKVFQAMIDQGVQTIMAGHIALPWVDPFLPGQKRPRPATVSSVVLTHLLRERMGFSGVVVSDALIMAGYAGWADRETRLIESFNAGIDIILWPGEDYFELMERALADGRVSPSRLDESVRRVLTLKARIGLADALIGDGNTPIELTAEVSHGADAVAQAIAQRSITLVRNRERLLPLDLKKVKRVLVHKAVPTDIDPKALSHLDEFVSHLKARGLEVTVLQNGNCLDVSKLEKEGQRWDAYLVIYSQHGHQVKNSVRPVGPMAEVIWTQQYTETLHPITISLGTPFLLYDMPFLDTLVNAYSPSSRTMESLAAALCGELEFATNSPVQIRDDPWILKDCGRI